MGLGWVGDSAPVHSWNGEAPWEAGIVLRFVLESLNFRLILRTPGVWRCFPQPCLDSVRAWQLGRDFLPRLLVVDGRAGASFFHLESPTNDGARRAVCLSWSGLLPPWAAYFSFVYKLALLPFNFYLFLVASKTLPEDNGLFVNHHLVGFWRGKLGGENVMFCGLFVVQKEVLRCRKSHAIQTFKWRQMFCFYC